MGKVKLTYFDFSGSRGEECRLALAVAGVDFEDHRVQRADWLELKPSLPFRSMPVLEVEGQFPLSQANAILRLIGRQHGLLPSQDEWECARIESLMDACEDLRSKVSATFGIEDKDALRKKRSELVEGPLTSFAECMEQQVKGTFVGGDDISVADIKLYVVVGWIQKGVLEHVPADLFDAYPKLSALVRAVAANPEVLAWTASHSS
jgi:glutathione S-transferase